MSVVIVGGNECMVRQYEDICKKHGYRAKFFAKENGSLKKRIGSPDLLILFTNTGAAHEAKRIGVPIARIHTSSANALHTVLNKYDK